MFDPQCEGQLARTARIVGSPGYGSLMALYDIAAQSEWVIIGRGKQQRIVSYGTHVGKALERQRRAVGSGPGIRPARRRLGATQHTGTGMTIHLTI